MSPASPDPVMRSVARLGILASALVLSTVPAGAEVAPAEDPTLERARRALSRMPLADRAAQLLMTSVPGVSLDPRAAATLRELRPGGVILFGANHRSRPQLARLTRSIQRAVRTGATGAPGVLVSVDQEGGVVRRIPSAPPDRSHPQLGAAGRPLLTRAQGRATAASLAPLGIHLNLAPVADLDIGPERVMRLRSFGTRPAAVGAHVGAFVTGLHEGGMAATAKHFPGFGGADVNSDDALARVHRSRLRLRADLVPFRSAVAAGVDAVMLSHGVYTRIDRRRPASTSPAIYAMLRRDLGFSGLAITDSLHAAGFTAATRRSIPAGCAAVVAAGADIALLTGSLADAVACRRALVASVRAGTLPKARVDEAALRVLVAKERLGLLPASPS